jgi:hypothetical protein
MPIRKALSALAVVSIVFASLAGLTLVFAQPPPQPRGPQEQPRLPFGDVFGRFRVSLPSGAAPISATYNFTISTSKAQVGITAMTQEPMFQTTMQNFPNMMQEMGARIESDKRRNVRGRQGQFVATTLKDPRSEMVMRSLNVFVPGPNVWVQVTGPAQNTPQLDETLEMLLKTIQF